MRLNKSWHNSLFWISNAFKVNTHPSNTAGERIRHCYSSPSQRLQRSWNPPWPGCHVSNQPSSSKMTPVTSAPLHLLQLLRDSSVLRDWTLQTLRPQWTSKHTLASTTAPWMMALHLSSLLHFVTTKLFMSNGWCLLHLGINHSLSPDSNKFADVRPSK